jgi:ketosteroid isomerase-like protein
MREEDMEVVRDSWAAWSRGDLDSLFADYWDRDIAWDMTHFREWPDRRYQGTAGVRRFLSEWLEVWGDYEADVDEILAAPDGRVVTLAWQRGRGRESGLAMDMKWAQLVTISGGKIIRVENYDDPSEALEAAGLSG